MATEEGSSDRAAPMAAAPFVWRTDGRPDWRAMWTTFCELALFGGPPHRGPEHALRGSRDGEEAGACAPDQVAEMRRGIWETTGLYSEPGAPGWMAITCESRAMAEWLGAAIVLENVEARIEDDRVLVPAGPRFRLEDQVKSIVTVLAKTHHYAAIHARVGTRGMEAGRHGFRCPSCGLDVHVSRPAATAELEATCPVDGDRMGRYGPFIPQSTPTASVVALPRGLGPLKLGVGGSAPTRTALIDALRRRYGRRRAVVSSPAHASEVNDHAVDLVLVALEEEDDAPSVVDATVGVFAASAVADALRRDDRGFAPWHLLVVSTAGAAKGDLPRLEADTARWRGERPSVFVDLTTGAGIDGVVSWLREALGLDPWRTRPG